MLQSTAPQEGRRNVMGFQGCSNTWESWGKKHIYPADLKGHLKCQLAVSSLQGTISGGRGHWALMPSDAWQTHPFMINQVTEKQGYFNVFVFYYLFIYVSNHFTAWTSNLWKASVSIGAFGSEAPGNPFQFLYPGESFHHLDPRAKRQGLWGQQVGLNRRLHITQLPCFLLVD